MPGQDILCPGTRERGFKKTVAGKKHILLYHERIVMD